MSATSEKLDNLKVTPKRNSAKSFSDKEEHSERFDSGHLKSLSHLGNFFVRSHAK